MKFLAGETLSTHPIVEKITDENGNVQVVKSVPVNISKNDFDEIVDGTKELKIVNNKVQVIESTRKADQEKIVEDFEKAQEEKAQELQNLKEKLESKTASLDEIQLALSKLI